MSPSDRLAALQRAVITMEPASLEQAERELQQLAGIVKQLDPAERATLAAGLSNLRHSLAFADTLYRGKAERIAGGSLYNACGNPVDWTPPVGGRRL